MQKNNAGVTVRLVVFVVFLLGGCAATATQVAYVSAAPIEKNCTLNIFHSITVTSFDGDQVNWKAGASDGWASVQIPQGRHTFRLHFARDVHDGRQFRSGITVSYDNFIAGHTYEMVAAAGAEGGGFAGLFTNMLQAMDDTVRQRLRIGIRDVTNGQDGDFTWLQWE